jgi:hypothetical protein
MSGPVENIQESLRERYRQELIDAITASLNQGRSPTWASQILSGESMFYRKLLNRHDFRLTTLMSAHRRIPLLAHIPSPITPNSEVLS